MAEGDGLGGLEMGKARHHRAGILKRLLGERELKRAKRNRDGSDFVPHIEPEIGCHLVVARTRRVQLAGHRPDQLAQAALDIQMNVFERAREFELARLDLRHDLVKPARDLLGLFGGDDAGLAQHGDMRL